MKMNKKTMMKRIVSLTMLLLAVALAFSGCGKKAAKPTLTLPATIDSAEGGNLSSSDLKAVGEMLISVYDDTDFDVRDWLIAAQRGYDMTAEGFDDKTVDPTALGTADPVSTALNVLNQANDKASDKNKIEKSIYAVYNEDGTVNLDESLNEADLNQLVNNFKTTVDTTAKGGLWDKILCGIGACLNWMTRNLGFGSYIVGICIFAIVVEILLLPFAIKQQKNTIRQAKLRPKEMAIRNKYKGRNDQVTQQKVAQEIQELYQRENYSPASGCLQLLLQFPILIALYNIVIDPLHYVLGQGAGVSAAMKTYYTAARAAGGLGQTLSGSTNSTIALLSDKSLNFNGIADFAYFNNSGEVWDSLQGVLDKIPDFNIFGINFGNTPGLNGDYILLLVPVLTFVVYFFSMRISRKFMYQPTQAEGNDRQVACSNTMMDVSMPLMSTFFAFAVPAIIGVYWMFRSVLGTLKQFIMSRVMPLPQFTEEEYKAAAREMAGKAPKKVEKSERAGTVRSLHHIDDEDYEDTRERAQKRAEAVAAKEKAEQAEKVKKTPFSAPEMKPDREEEKKLEAQKEEKTETVDSDDDAQN